MATSADRALARDQRASGHRHGGHPVGADGAPPACPACSGDRSRETGSAELSLRCSSESVSFRVGNVEARDGLRILCHPHRPDRSWRRSRPADGHRSRAAPATGRSTSPASARWRSISLSTIPRSGERTADRPPWSPTAPAREARPLRSPPPCMSCLPESTHPARRSAASPATSRSTSIPPISPSSTSIRTQETARRCPTTRSMQSRCSATNSITGSA